MVPIKTIDIGWKGVGTSVFCTGDGELSSGANRVEGRGCLTLFCLGKTHAIVYNVAMIYTTEPRGVRCFGKAVGASHAVRRGVSHAVQWCNMSTQLVVRIDESLKEKANNLATREGKHLSELVRELLEDYVRERDISGYIDDLWDRLGTKLADQGVTHADIETTIHEVRTEHATSESRP